MVDAPEVARRFDERHRVREQCAPFEAQRWNGHAGDIRPILHLEDLSTIPFLAGIRGIELYQHRARVRAHDRSLFAAVTPPVDGYERWPGPASWRPTERC